MSLFEIFLVSTLYWGALLAFCIWLNRRISKLEREIEKERAG